MKHGTVLSPREKAFVRAYCGSANQKGSTAALHAGYEGDINTRSSVAWRLLRRPRIRRAIDRRLSGRVAGSRELQIHLSDVATAPWREFMELQYDDAGKVTSAKLRLGDKLKAAEILLRIQGKLTDPAARMMDVLMRGEIMRLIKTQKATARELAAQAKVRSRARARQALLPAGHPDGEPLEVSATEVMEETTPLPTSNAARHRS